MPANCYSNINSIFVQKYVATVIIVNCYSNINSSLWSKGIKPFISIDFLRYQLILQ